MRLVQDGRLNLDADVNTELTGWKLPENAFTAKQAVTLRELLSHTAGTTVHGFWGYDRGTPVPTLQQVLDGTKPANSPAVRVDLQPGTQYRYSGGGYVIAELLANQATHEPFATYMQTSVLGPMGMTDSTFEQPLPIAWQSRAATATDADGKPYPGGWQWRIGKHPIIGLSERLLDFSLFFTTPLAASIQLPTSLLSLY